MLTFPVSLQERTSLAIERVRAALREDVFYEELSRSELSSFQDHIAGWKTATIPSLDFGLLVLLPRLFPDLPPAIFIEQSGPQLFLQNPHVFCDRSICFLPSSASLDSESPEGIVFYCVKRCIEILTEEHTDDFGDEFLTYWGLARSANSRDFLIAHPIDSTAKHFYAALLKNYVVAGSTVESVTHWLRAMSGESDRQVECAEFPIVDLRKPLLPAQYPDTVWDLRKLLDTLAPSFIDRFDGMLCEGSGNVPFLLRQPTIPEPVFAGIVVRTRAFNAHTIVPGFRKGKATDGRVVAEHRHELKKQKVARCPTHRVDHSWIHTRGGEGTDFNLKRVLLIGGGSLGGYVAHLLARAGVGHLMILDNDTLGWENVGRHVLGAPRVGESKSESLKDTLQHELPHLAIDSFQGDWRQWLSSIENADFNQYDIVVSTVGDWGCERPLNFMKVRELETPILFGWLEPYGVGGHGLLVSSKGGCLECGTDSFGHFTNRLANFENTTLQKEPGGCAYYQQYGPLSVVPVAEVIARLAIESLRKEPTSSQLRTWVGPVEDITVKGGALNRHWKRRIDEALLAQCIKSEWPRNPKCKACSGS